MLVETAFATAAEMAERSQGRIPASTPFLEKELMAATAAISNACGWHVAGREAIEYNRTGPAVEMVWLPAMRIQSVSAVVLDGVTIDPASVEFDRDTGWTNMRGRVVHVEFTAGFDPVPADLVSLTLELAAGGLVASGNLSREQAGAVSVTFTRTSAAITPDDDERLAAYRLGRLP